MPKSLIRKNQLHPDVGDLVSGYGSGYFVTFDELEFILDEYNPEIELTGQNVVYTTGTQTISGQKSFDTRPRFNGSGLATTGELGGSTSFSGARQITADVIGFKGLIPGGNDVVSFLNNVFFPFVSGSITLNNFATQELGKTVTNINFVGTINTGSLRLNQFTNVEGYVNNVARLPLLIPVVQNFNWSVGVNLSTRSDNVYIKATGVNQVGSPIEIVSNVQSIVFEAPTFAGSGIDNLQNNPANMKAILSGQNSLGGNNGKTVMQEPSSFQVQVYTNNSWFYIVYPSGWGALSRIANPQLGDFNINTDFTQGFVTLTLDNNVTTHPYRYYKRTLPTTLTNYPVIYYF
jgi:hypothetical protein